MAPTRADSHGIGLTRAVSAEMAETDDSGRNSKKKKKKKMQNTPFDLYLNPTSAHFTQTPKHKLSTSPHISSLTRLCAICLSAFLPLFRLPCGYETFSHSALTQFTASIHSFFSFLSCTLNSGIIIKLSILVWSLICDLWLMNLWFVTYESMICES